MNARLYYCHWDIIISRPSQQRGIRYRCMCTCIHTEGHVCLPAYLPACPSVCLSNLSISSHLSMSSHWCLLFQSCMTGVFLCSLCPNSEKLDFHYPQDPHLLLILEHIGSSFKIANPTLGKQNPLIRIGYLFTIEYFVSPIL